MWAKGGRECVCVFVCDYEWEREKERHTKWPNSLSCVGFPALAMPRQNKRRDICWRPVTPLQLAEQQNGLPVPVTRYLFPSTSGSNCLLNAVWWSKCRVTFDATSKGTKGWPCHGLFPHSNFHHLGPRAPDGGPSWVLRLEEVQRAPESSWAEAFGSEVLLTRHMGAWVCMNVRKHILRCYRCFCVHWWFCSQQDLMFTERMIRRKKKTFKMNNLAVPVSSKSNRWSILMYSSSVVPKLFHVNDP